PLRRAVEGRVLQRAPARHELTGGVEVERASRRAIVLVIDACGVGALPDAAAYGDEGTNTLGHLAEAVGGLDLPTLTALGVGSIEQLGAEHLRTGALILYTSQDSVLQLAAHVDRLEPSGLYSACEVAREAMTGEHAVGRVIARPFTGTEGAFARTEGRRDFALAPPPG